MVDKETRERGKEEEEQEEEEQEEQEEEGEEQEEEEVNYASVVFKSKMSAPKGEENRHEEADTEYDDVQVLNGDLEQRTSAGGNDQKHTFKCVVICLGILCVILAAMLIARSLYVFVSELQRSKDNQSALLAYDHLGEVVGNLTSADENLNETQKLRTELEAKIKEASRLNLTCAQSPIDAYCHTENGRSDGWIHNRFSCYGIFNHENESESKTWSEARDACRGRNADLVIINNEEEQVFVYNNSYDSTDASKGYWLGLSKPAGTGKWSWVDGTEVTLRYWTGVNGTGSNSHCALIWKHERPFGWSTVDCKEKRRWMPCEDGWIHNRSSCYVVFDHENKLERKTWSEARDACRRRNADLVVINDEEEQALLYNNSYGSTDASEGYWLGLSKPAGTGKWSWVDGTEVTLRYWTGVNGTGSNSHCALIWKNERPFGWSTVDCKEKRRWMYQKHTFKCVAICLGILCVILAAMLITRSLYVLVSELQHSKDNQSALLAYDHLVEVVENLTSANENLVMSHSNLSRSCDILQNETQKLRTELEAKIKEAIRLKLTCAQSPIDAYCHIENGRSVCRPCEVGWIHNRFSCYAIFYNVNKADRKTWSEARDVCRGRNADLVVINDEEEQAFVYNKSYGSTDASKGYWLGLSKLAGTGKWSWVDGTEVTLRYWTGVNGTGSNSLCAQIWKYERAFVWSAVYCKEKRLWITKTYF
ncbi:Macrophage mannose receptor 1 [Merluccius polli]|uniref:Macrophage mannose receptor 1 n=1 Tax=Merluccius polli TaxID=89951 RepID=A0AA47NBH4_MERPO|nr:Macrophage mannose receptor 1 [Merluccius polli]